MVPAPAPGSVDAVESGLVAQHQRDVTGKAAGVGIRQAQRRRMGQHRHGHWRRPTWRRRWRASCPQQVGARDRAAPPCARRSPPRAGWARDTKPQACSTRAQSRRMRPKLGDGRAERRRRRASRKERVPRAASSAMPPASSMPGDRSTPVAKHGGEFLRLRGTGLMMRTAVGAHQTDA